MMDKTGRTARQWALRALGRRMHTAWEIERGLTRRGWPSETARGVVNDLRKDGYIDDLQFAEIWVASRSQSRLHGRFRLLRDLLAKGVQEDLAENVIKKLLPRDKETANARKAAERKARLMKTIDVRAMAALQRHLMSKGFQSDVVREVLSSFFSEEKQC
jgi:regulatory protein